MCAIHNISIIKHLQFHSSLLILILFNFTAKVELPIFLSFILRCVKTRFKIFFYLMLPAMMVMTKSRRWFYFIFFIFKFVRNVFWTISSISFKTFFFVLYFFLLFLMYARILIEDGCAEFLRSMRCGVCEIKCGRNENSFFEFLWNTRH